MKMRKGDRVIIVGGPKDGAIGTVQAVTDDGAYVRLDSAGHVRGGQAFLTDSSARNRTSQLHPLAPIHRATR